MGSKINIKEKKKSDQCQNTYHYVLNCVTFILEATCLMTLNPEQLPMFYEPGLSVNHVFSQHLVFTLPKVTNLLNSNGIHVMQCNCSHQTTCVLRTGAESFSKHHFSPVKCQAQKVVGSTGWDRQVELNHTREPPTPSYRVWSSASEQ